MLIELRHGEPIRFGADREKGVIIDQTGEAAIVDVADVGEDAILVHDETRPNPSVAFALSRIAAGPHEPTPVGVFRSTERQEFASANATQVRSAKDEKRADLAALLRSNPTWDVD